MDHSEESRLLGRALKERREAMGISPEEMNDSLLTPYSDLSSLRRIERGENRIDRDVLLAMLKTLGVNDEAEINYYLSLGKWAPLTAYEVDCFCHPAQLQKVRETVNDNKPPGIVIENETGSTSFLPWAKLSKEIDDKLLPQVYSMPGGSHAVLRDHIEADGSVKKDWLIRVVNAKGVVIAGIWFGGDPEKEWAIDGLVRIGPAKTSQAKPHRVWEVYGRYSDSTYRKIGGVLGPKTYGIPNPSIDPPVGRERAAL